MERNKSNFTRLDEVNTDKVSVKGSFPPWFPKDSIGLHLPRIVRLCDLGGLRHLTIDFLENGETSQVEHNVVGFNQNGEALAGKAKTSMISTHTDQIEEWERYGHLPAMRYIHGNIAINLSEMGQRIRYDDKSQEGVRSPRPWAHLINEALCQGIGRLGIENSLNYPHPEGWVYIFALCVPLYLELPSNFLPSEMASLEVFAKFLAASAFLSGALGLYVLRESCFDGNEDLQYRWSLFPGPQLDRALAIAALTKTQQLAKTVAGLK